MAASMCVGFRRTVGISCFKGDLTKRHGLFCNIFLQERGFAARKGKRAAVTAKKKTAKLESQDKPKTSLPSYMKVDRSVLKVRTNRLEDEKYLVRQPVDDVWFKAFYKTQCFTVEEALKMHREALHPTLLNKPDALVHATIELNMKTQKKTKFLEPFTLVIGFPHRFVYKEEKRVVAFCSSSEDIDASIEAGALAAGGTDLVKQFQNGKYSHADYDYVVSQIDFVPELSVIRGLLKKNYPNKSLGNFGTNMAYMINLFKYGINITAQRDTVEREIGWIDIPFGRLDMSDEQLKENFAKILISVEKFKPTKVTHPFIKDTIIWAPPSQERLYVSFWKNIEGYDSESMESTFTILGPDHYPIVKEQCNA